jgi:nucleoside-diphosphate-sugar epimerase
VDQLEVDFEDGAAVRAAIARIRPRTVFHLAAHGAYSWQTERRRIVAVNFIGTLDLLEACVDHGVEVVVHTGSSSEYGFKDHAPPESEAPEPNSDYAVAKAAATLLGGHISRSTGTRVVTLRLYSVYGPWEEPNRLVPTLIARALGGELPPLVSPQVARDFVHVDDVTDALLLAAEPQASGVYNLGSGAQTTVAELVDLVRELFDVRAAPEWGSLAERIWDTSTWVADSTRIRQDLGWEPRIAMREGLRSTADWLRDRPELWERYGLADA